MQMIIEIPQEVYEHAKENTEGERDEVQAIRAVAKGMPLPNMWVIYYGEGEETNMVTSDLIRQWGGVKKNDSN